MRRERALRIAGVLLCPTLTETDVAGSALQITILLDPDKLVNLNLRNKVSAEEIADMYNLRHPLCEPVLTSEEDAAS